MTKQFDQVVLDMAKILDNRKAIDIRIIDVSKQTILSDYFLIASGRSNVHVKTLADELTEKMAKSKNMTPIRQEGYQEGRWIVLDYGDILVHLFHTEEREFYDIERLWEDDDNFMVYEGQPDEA